MPSYWRLKTTEEYESDTTLKSKETRKYVFNCIEDISQVKNIKKTLIIIKKKFRFIFLPIWMESILCAKKMIAKNLWTF